MTTREAFDKYCQGRTFDLPWEPGDTELWDVWQAAWLARGEADKQTELFPAGEANLDLQPTCNGKAASSTLASGSIVGSDTTALFTAEDIWNAWMPNMGLKKARGAAIPAIRKALKNVAPILLFNAVEEYSKAVAAWPAADRQFVPMCSTWMNQERWTDDRATWNKGNATPGSQWTKKYS